MDFRKQLFDSGYALGLNLLTLPLSLPLPQI